MNNWQEWVVGVLIVLCIARVIYGIYLFFRRTRESENPCDSCVSGCDLKAVSYTHLTLPTNREV